MDHRSQVPCAVKVSPACNRAEITEIKHKRKEEKGQNEREKSEKKSAEPEREDKPGNAEHEERQIARAEEIHIKAMIPRDICQEIIHLHCQAEEKDQKEYHIPAGVKKESLRFLLLIHPLFRLFKKYMGYYH